MQYPWCLKLKFLVCKLKEGEGEGMAPWSPLQWLLPYKGSNPNPQCWWSRVNPEITNLQWLEGSVGLVSQRYWNISLYELHGNQTLVAGMVVQRFTQYVTVPNTARFVKFSSTWNPKKTITTHKNEDFDTLKTRI